MIKVRDIAQAIEEFAPKNLQEDYDNAGLQVGDPEMTVSAVLLCLDVTEEILEEALDRSCNMIVSHHPLLFKGLKEITGATATERIVIKAIRSGVAIYAAHTNLDSAWDGVSHEIAHSLGLTGLSVLDPSADNVRCGIGVLGETRPTPTLEFLRKVKETFNVKALRYSAQSTKLVIKKVAVCGGSGAFLIKKAIERGADVIITGDVKYHDFTNFGLDILIADIGHYESELCSQKIFSRIIRGKFPDSVIYFSDKEKNPINYL